MKLLWIFVPVLFALKVDKEGRGIYTQQKITKSSGIFCTVIIFCETGLAGN